MQGHRPPRPTHLECSDRLWALMQRCWDRKPLLRPKVSEVLQVLPCSDFDKLQRLYVPWVASHKFQLALSRFYGSSEYQDSIEILRGPDLKQFVDFLDTVRQPSDLFHLNALFDSRSRCSGLKDWIKEYSNKRCTTCGEFVVIGPSLQAPV